MANIYEIVCDYDIKHRTIFNRIAKRLHSERKAHGYTQADLGKEIGCSRQRVASWEEGWNNEEAYPEHLPEIEHLVKLCSLYDCDPGYLLCEYDEKKRIIRDIDLSILDIASAVQSGILSVVESIAERYGGIDGMKDFINREIQNELFREINKYIEGKDEKTRYP